MYYFTLSCKKGNLDMKQKCTVHILCPCRRCHRIILSMRCDKSSLIRSNHSSQFSSCRCIDVPHEECKTSFKHKCEKKEQCDTIHKKKCLKIPYQTCKNEPVRISKGFFQVLIRFHFCTCFQ